ncbi:hypothetical protein J2W97_003708 [Paenibacillus jamilae]|mgnify:CR=1 FL=1|uniref:hypothetical protein n=1 Tax=Paenibacillus TaxID=44249 RepID=UPI000D3215E1|nr:MULTISPECIES: hypothetical protein [Paenibacillus]MDP9677698.1 hypothetical protein [Paenibacillus jamilae]KAF6621489.1 hypothetical protein HFE00_02270 [Paenibacillus sp. EKM101P]KAF6622794.1 hypothetical protein HFE03_11735 [Paenibacillus sp. EKM102P]KAF6632646.1 hypothetical protein HFE01_11775 [Paenibacillus sp. EKM10P]KAF6647398.1 hypothetical protein HFE02_13830 [Paenibacillus sp. EKM11P]
MKNRASALVFALLAAALLPACSTKESATPVNKSNGAVVRSIFDLDHLESTTVYTGRAKIESIERIKKEVEQPLAAPTMDYLIRFERPVQFARELPQSDDPAEKPIQSVYISVPDTHIYKQMDGQQRQLIRPAELQVGQPIEVSYVYPATPVFLALEIIVLDDL